MSLLRALRVNVPTGEFRPASRIRLHRGVAGLTGEKVVAECSRLPSAAPNHIEMLDTRIIAERVAQVGLSSLVEAKNVRFAPYALLTAEFRIGTCCVFLTRRMVATSWSGLSAAGQGKEMTGEAVIDYFTNEAIKMDAEVKQFF